MKQRAEDVQTAMVALGDAVRDEVGRARRELELEYSSRFDELNKTMNELISENISLKKMLVEGYFLEDMRGREKFERQELFYNVFKALTFNSIGGDYVEFGCHGCMTFPLAYHEAARHGHGARLWAFDSFQGLPPATGPEDKHPRWVESKMATSIEEFHRRCKKKGVPREAYEIVAGFYEDTLPRKSETDAPADVCFAFIDCDMYSSTKCALEFLTPRLKHGMIVAFDDYYCWSPSQISGERRAMLELFDASYRWRLVPYLQFGWHGASFFVEENRDISPGR
jgi:O-methyltransferase